MTSPVTLFGWPGALPSLYSRTAGPEFDKAPKQLIIITNRAGAGEMQDAVAQAGGKAANVSLFMG
jgi:hypothetical protein